jgi:hypothetical protein
MMENGLTIVKVISLALADALNPCALAALTMMLLSIITYDPRNRKNIIYSGLAFSTAIFLMYMIYGIFIIKSFYFMRNIVVVHLWLYKTLGSLAILLGILQIKDFFFYKPGNIATEMPKGFRSRVKKIVTGVTSPYGAFGVGLFITIFLLPCTIGPYIILGGMLSFMEIFKILPILAFYNFVFIMPLLIATGIIYFGLSRIEDIVSWKNKNIKVLHLISGIIILILGVAMVTGLV